MAMAQQTTAQPYHLNPCTTRTAYILVVQGLADPFAHIPPPCKIIYWPSFKQLRKIFG